MVCSNLPHFSFIPVFHYSSLLGLFPPTFYLVPWSFFLLSLFLYFFCWLLRPDPQSSFFNLVPWSFLLSHVKTWHWNPFLPFHHFILPLFPYSWFPGFLMPSFHLSFCWMLRPDPYSCFLFCLILLTLLFHYSITFRLELPVLEPSFWTPRRIPGRPKTLPSLIREGLNHSHNCPFLRSLFP